MPPRRLQALLFVISLITFAWFHQGGGWNQNARFAEVRAIVEQGRLAIDDYLIYRNGEGQRLVRPRIVNGEFMHGGRLHQLTWGEWEKRGTPEKPQWQQLRVTGQPLDPAAEPVVVGEGTCTGDVGFAPGGHFHPNKPPGVSLLAVPPYFLLYHAERALGLDPDDWRVMNANLWLCSVLTAGLASALGVVLLLRLAAQMVPGRPGAALAAAVTFGFGTTFFPFGTLMFDHNITATLLLAAFASARAGRPAAAGVWSGIAAVTNYLAAVPGALFALWMLCRRRRNDECRMTNAEGPAEGAGSSFVIRHSSFGIRQRLNWGAVLRFTLGVLPCLALLLAYNTAAFGSPLSLNTSFQNPAFMEETPAFLGMFTAPSWFAAIAVTVSPWRGLFMLSPVLIVSLACLIRRENSPLTAGERRLFLGCAAYFFLINICFNGFHGGYAAGPRYLIPALPFLCLPLAWAFVRRPRTTAVLAAAGIVQQALLTATDAQNPLGVGTHAWVNHPGEWKEKLAGNSLVWRYAWPMFAQGRAWPVIHAKFDEWLLVRRAALAREKLPAPEIEARLEKLRGEAWDRVLRGDPDPLWLAAMPGPVSANVVGPWDGSYFDRFPVRSPESAWASFNAGEFIFPASRWSLAPLLALWAAGAFWIRRSLTPTSG